MKTSSFALIVAGIALIVGGIAYALHAADPAYNFVVLLTGNLIMAALSLLSFILVSRQFAGRPQAFVQGASTASLLKLFVCGGGILAYALINKPDIHKPTLFLLLGIYFVYTVAEKIILSNAARKMQSH